MRTRTPETAGDLMEERMIGAGRLGERHYCGQRHRTWSGLARCIFRELRPLWIRGQGEWATLAYCPPGLTVMLHATRGDAERALAQIDRTGCGGRCEERHYLRLLAAAPAELKGSQDAQPR